MVALSGGVDSSAAAALLVQAGYTCIGVFMVTSNHNRHAQTEARSVADRLGITLHVLDLRRDFEQILDYFCSEYRRGRTPNPCVLCNRLIKFGKLWDFAQSHGAQFLATGHYARVFKKNGQAALYEAADTAKDQSYALTMIDRNVLPHLILPLGSYSKRRAREIAASLGLGIERRTESQEICFIPGDDYAAVLEKLHPDAVRTGPIVDNDGKVLGEHDGAHRFTIGQRRGLRVAVGKPYYVTQIDAASNTVTLGPEEQLMHSRLKATGVNWLVDEPDRTFPAIVKIRYNDDGAPAEVIPKDDGVLVDFAEPNRAITPGQLAAFYIDEGRDAKLIGGGWINKAVE
jgi:tRNA-specific 2-thiouridylase